MNKNIDPRQQPVRDMVQPFAEKEIRPVSEKLDHMPEPRPFPRDLYTKLGVAGFIGFAMPEKLGGGGKSQLEYVTLLEELCYHDAAVGLMCAVGGQAAFPIISFGGDGLAKKFVPDCAAGKKVAAFVLTEPGADSDASHQ
ncbi:MAG: acyl-CoA dehydrogenase family protein, partial [Candidatus Zixiibacteriota bacterium]